MTSETGPDRRELTDRERHEWLRLIRSDNVGPITFRELIRHFGNANAALKGVAELASRGGRSIRLCSPQTAEAEMEAIARHGGRLVAIGEADYPAWLARIDDPPPLLTVIGNKAIFERSVVAIVGSRNASLAGCKFARMMARDLGDAGYVIVSGLARGIDAAAHEAALRHGTIAVLAGGPDRIYPANHVDLARTIADSGGALVTEMPYGWEPRARDFPRRNRIVSGMAMAVMVIEAAQRSGSLITARLANEQGRLVFAAPGSPLDPRSAGANRLIRDGASILTGSEDILSELEPMRSRPPSPLLQAEEGEAQERSALGEPGDTARDAVRSALGTAPVEMDEICRFTQLKPAVIHLCLLELDLAGSLVRHSGGRVSLA